MADQNLLGVHCSISGGVHNACKEAGSLEANTFQIFTKNQRTWKEREYTKEEVGKFKEAYAEAGIEVAFSHSSYLINLAHQKEEKREQSINALINEVQRCHDLGLPFVVLHPGFPKDDGEKVGIERISKALTQVLEETSHTNVKILTENMAGQGSAIGGKFEHLAEIRQKVGSDRIGTCFDTCHAFAAGYDVRTPGKCEKVMQEWDEIVGIDQIDAFHLNDSKNPFDSRKDRHEHIGEGEIGAEGFRYFMKEFPHIPKVLETPKEDDMDHVNLNRLRQMVDET